MENIKRITQLREILENDPDNHEAWNELGMQYFSSDFREARRCFSRAIALDPFNAEYIFHRGWKCLSTDDYEDAMADLTLAVRMDPTDGLKWHYLANAYFFMNAYEQAIKLYRTAITMYQTSGVNLVPSSVDWMWMSYMRLGKKQAAQAVLDEFITPDIPVVGADIVYKERVLMYAGYTPFKEFLAHVQEGENVDVITKAYAASFYYRFVLEDNVNADKLLNIVLDVPTKHHCFGYKLALKDKQAGIVQK